MRAVAHCLIAAITICSWLAISNHCAIRALTTKAEKTQSACPFHSKPAKPKTNSTECCKILRATPNLPAKTLAPAIVDLAPANFFDLVVAAPRKISFATATLDTGPPGKTSFAELNRSMRAHAPPFVA